MSIAQDGASGLTAFQPSSITSVSHAKDSGGAAIEEEQEESSSQNYPGLAFSTLTSVSLGDFLKPFEPSIPLQTLSLRGGIHQQQASWECVSQEPCQVCAAGAKESEVHLELSPDTLFHK
jgi:hypothetical protein